MNMTGMSALMCAAILGAPETASPPIARVTVSEQGPVRQASEMLLGHNLEAALDTIPGMLSDRLDNPKFLGPADPITGIAPGWRHNSDNMNEVRCELTPGAGMSGYSAQLIQNLSSSASYGILQNRRQVRAGERFEVEVWARAWRHPVTIEVGLLPLASRFPPYSQASIEVDTSFYQRYTAELSAPVDDNEAAFFCLAKGEGAVWVDQIHLRPVDEPHLCRELVARIAELRIPVLRFPGGVQSTTYRWRHGVGPVELRPVMPDPAFKRALYYDFGTDEYLELCHSQGILPQITVNICFGTPEEAADWATYCAEWYRKKGAEPPPVYFQIGNHPYLSAELAHMTPEMYVEVLRAYVPAIRERYPTARIMAVCDPYHDAWRTTLLEQASDLFDVMALQAYATQPAQESGPGSPISSEDARVQMETVALSVDHLAGVIRKHIDACRSRGLKQNLAFVEWNLWGQASHRDGRNFFEPLDVQHSLFAAGMLHAFIGLAPDLEVATFYHLVNPMGIFIHRGPEVEEMPMADVFRLYRDALPGEALPVEVQSPRLGEWPAVDAVAVRNAQGTWVYLVNRDPGAAIEAELVGLDVAGGTVSSLVGESLTGAFTRDEKPLTGHVIPLPPLSIHRVHLAP